MSDEETWWWLSTLLFKVKMYSHYCNKFTRQQNKGTQVRKRGQIKDAIYYLPDGRSVLEKYFIVSKTALGRPVKIMNVKTFFNYGLT